MHVDRCGNTTGRRETKIQAFMWNMKCMIIPVIIVASGLVTKGLKKNLEAILGKLRRFTTQDMYTWNITHNTESTAVRNLKPERWRLPLVQEKYQGEKGCDKRRRRRRHSSRNVSVYARLLEDKADVFQQHRLPPHIQSGAHRFSFSNYDRRIVQDKPGSFKQ